LDLSLSPDLEAWWCYFILASLSLMVAVVQVRSLLKGYTNVWSTARAWLLLGAYTGVPIALFWFLDRADALHDTSLFAAVLVGVTYRQILSGSGQGVNVPGTLAKAWQPFVTWSDNVAAGIRNRIARNNSRYDAIAIDHLAESQDVFGEVQNIVLNRASDPASARSMLDSYDKLKPPLDDSGVLRKKATYLYFALKALPDVDSDRLLMEKSVISRSNYYLYAREWRSSIFVGIFVVMAVAVAVLAATHLPSPENRALYYLWRFEKPNATNVDRFRAAQHLEAGMRSGNTDFAAVVRKELTTKLRYDGLPLDAGERTLQLLLQTAGHPDPPLIRALAYSIRTGNPDLRARTEKVLLYLADAGALEVPGILQKWTPTKEDSVTCIDAAANMWNRLGEAGAKLPANASLPCLVGTSAGTQNAAAAVVR
jgi:hypothetical protein